MEAFKIGCLGFGSTSTSYLWQLANIKVNPQLQRMIEGAHSIDPVIAAAIAQKPMITFDTHAIGTMLGLCGPDGLTKDEVYAWFPERAHGGMISSGEAHVKITAYRCLIVLQSIRVSQDQPAIGSFAIYPTYDGSNAPLAYAKDQALPERAADVSEQAYTNGPLYLGETAIETQGWTFDLGANIFTPAMNGEAYPRMAAIAERRPTVSVQTLDLESITSAGMMGTSVDDVLLYLRALTMRGAPVADATTSHIKLTIKEAFVSSDGPGGDSSGQATTELTVSPVDDGTNSTVAVASGVAIAAPA